MAKIFQFLFKTRAAKIAPSVQHVGGVCVYVCVHTRVFFSAGVQELKSLNKFDPTSLVVASWMPGAKLRFAEFPAVCSDSILPVMVTLGTGDCFPK